LTKPQKILAVMYDLCKGRAQPLLYEDIVVAAYKRYPEDFQLRGYPQYPDSSDIHKPLYLMKQRGYILAANKMFELTQRGIEVAQNLMHSDLSDKDRLTKQEEHEIDRIIKSAAFRLFQQKQEGSILDTDFYEYLGVTVRTAKGDFRGRLSNVEHAVQAHTEKRRDALSEQLGHLHKFLTTKFRQEIEARK
jgi:hypothetical protein